MHNLDAYQQIEKINLLHRIRRAAVFYKQCLKCSDNPKEIEAVKQGYKELLDSFYAEVSDYMPLSQDEDAGRDFEYFLKMIDLALACFIDGTNAKGQIQQPN